MDPIDLIYEAPEGMNLEWRKYAACRRVPWELFFRSGPVGPQHKALCYSCPVYKKCLDWAIAADEHGIWAATTRTDRERMREEGWSAGTASKSSTR